MLRETIHQITIENGRELHPTKEDVQQAMVIVENHRVHREQNNLEPIERFPYPLDYGYDIECYPNFFSFSITHIETYQRAIFEISNIDGVITNQAPALYQFLCMLREIGARLVGYNNEHYDYPMIHLFMEMEGMITCEQLYKRSQEIFADHTGYAFNVWANKRHLIQVDLLKIHHFDNKAKRTSLKMLEFNMRSENIKDLPFDPLKPVTRYQADELLTYNDHDVDETVAFYIHTLPMIQFRDELSKKYGKDFTNYNDTKIGKEYFIMELNKHGVQTKNGRDLIQSPRDSVTLNDVIFPYITFEHPEFNRILTFFKSSVLDKKDKNGMLELKGFFKDVSATIDGFQFDFGAGGIHGSLHKTIVRESDTHLLIDIDVASYYPNIAIANGLYPEHLSEKFCDIYLDVYKQRKNYPKGSPENAMLKLALNGVYGASNDKYSPFLDPKYTLATTVNGQLMLCMLAEHLMKIPNLKMVQINTDGLTFLCPREYEEHAMSLKTWWEQLTKLELERADYSLMAIRDVNSYLAVTTDGKIKRIGAYAYELAIDNPSTRELSWNKNQSAVVVAKAAEAALVHGTPIEEFIRKHDDEYDFMLRTKVPRDSNLILRENVMWGDEIAMVREVKLQNISRYYVSETGGKLIKVMPYTDKQLQKYLIGDFYQHEDSGEIDVVETGRKPKSGKWKLISVPANSPKRKPPAREIGIEVGWLVTDCCDMNDFNDDINYEYYIEETRKLVDELLLNENKSTLPDLIAKRDKILRECEVWKNSTDGSYNMALSQSGYHDVQSQIVALGG